MNFCKDCKFYRVRHYTAYSGCFSMACTSNPSYDLVTGGVKYAYPYTKRNDPLVETCPEFKEKVEIEIPDVPDEPIDKQKKSFWRCWR